ncbi:hypothetical protein ACN47E_000633 [Coniothyrium glycines]
MRYLYWTHLLPCVPRIWARQDPNVGHDHPQCSAEQFKLDEILPPTQVVTIESRFQQNYTSFGAGPWPALSGLNFCQVQVYVSERHPEQSGKELGPKVLYEIWLPLSHAEWNGRFQATGGAGFATGMFEAQLGAAVNSGWAAVSTNGGHGRYPLNSGDGSWLANEDGSINWTSMSNFAITSLVEQIKIGKAITKQYFGKEAHHSYWNGCSTGGRQGYAIAQRFPDLLDGILAEAPAISFTQLVTADFWPQLRMAMTDTYLSNCELEHYRAKLIEKCDVLDGVQDGILDNIDDCAFDPFELVRQKYTFDCHGTKTKFTPAIAQVLVDIQAGPGLHPKSPLFPGFAPGVPLTSVANITIANDGTRSQNPFRISASFLKHLVLKTPDFDLPTLDMPSYLELFGRASYELGGMLNADNPDLSALRASGTKLLSWHGLNDELIPFQNTVNYRRKVDALLGGTAAVDAFYRLFLAPGVQHCGGGIGPVPRDPLAALVEWVEHDAPPDTLAAETVNSDGELVTRDVCAWPARSKYMGISDPKRASSWSCEGGVERVAEEQSMLGGSRAQHIIGVLADRLDGLGLGLSIG